MGDLQEEGDSSKTGTGNGWRDRGDLPLVPAKNTCRRGWSLHPKYWQEKKGTCQEEEATRGEEERSGRKLSSRCHANT
jgi:hypothetical protein